MLCCLFFRKISYKNRFPVLIQTNREKLHRAIRVGNMEEVRRFIEMPDGHSYAIAKNYYGKNRFFFRHRIKFGNMYIFNDVSKSTGRTALHIAILKEREDIVQFLATTIKQTLFLGDNVSHLV